MSTTVVIYASKSHTRSKVVCDAMYTGISKIGDVVHMTYEDSYIGVDADVAVFYGLNGNLSRIFEEYSSKAKAVYVDLGYWGRRDGGRWSGYHKICINDRHPTKYFQSVKHDSKRSDILGVSIKRVRANVAGAHVLIAGMGDKGAEAEGFAVEQWEREVVLKIRSVCSRPIIYRPKPSWKMARRIDGVGFSPPTQSLEAAMANCHLIATHHSNVAVDGLVSGVPVYCEKGVSTVGSIQNICDLESASIDFDRQQWVNDLAYCQWSISEMNSGQAWKHLKDEGLL